MYFSALTPAMSSVSVSNASSDTHNSCTRDCLQLGAMALAELEFHVLLSTSKSLQLHLDALLGSSAFSETDPACQPQIYCL